MAAIAGGTPAHAGPTSTTSSTFQTVATLNTSGFKQDDGVYLLLVIAKLTGSDNANPVSEWRLAQGSTPTLIPRSLQILEMQSTSANTGQQYNFFTVFTQPATAEDVVFQIRSNDATATTRVDDLHFFQVS